MLSIKRKAACSSEWRGITITAKTDNVTYSLMINGSIFFLLGFLAEKSVNSRSLRRISIVLFWLAPSHLLTPLFYLVVEHKWQWSSLPTGWALSEIALIANVLFFTFASIPRQMKSSFFSGLFYLAVSLVWLTREHFRDNLIWPAAIFAVGFQLIGLTWRYPEIMNKST